MTEFSLHEFQEEDRDKFYVARSGLDASEMGTGKTHVGIALDEAWYKRWSGTKRARTLIIAPLNTHTSWREKYSWQYPSSDVVVIDRKNRGAFVDDVRLRRGDVFICHYEAARLMPELRNFGYQTVIADEVHRISNRKSQNAKTLHAIGRMANHRFAMSGTATGDKPDGLWSVLHWLWPQYYKSYWKFVRHYTIIEQDFSGYFKLVGVQNLDSLHQQIAPFYSRHLKKEQCCPHHPEGVAPWLPDKVYDRVWVDLSDTQRRVYEEMRKHMVAWVGEHENQPLTAGIVAAQLVRLSQMCLASPWIAEDGTVQLALPSSKIDAAAQLIQDGFKQFVVYSTSKKVCYLAQSHFERHGISCEVLSGDTPQRQREDMVGRFVKGDFQTYIAVLADELEGIDGLQHATDTAIFLDRSWSARINNQAEDRLHREGVKNTVQIIDIMARNTIDFGRLTKVGKKWQTIKAMLGDNVDQLHEIEED